MPHDLIADAKLTPTDVRVAAALLYWARGKDHCWPGDPAIAVRVGRSVGTVQRSLRRLVAAGWVARERTAANRTGRLIRLAWRGGARPAPAPAREPGPPPARDEGTVIVKRDPAKEVAAPARPRPGPAPRLPLTAELLRAWADSADPILRAEAARRLAPPPPARPEPASVPELLLRLREGPHHVARAAELLAQDLRDRPSWAGFHAACRRAYEGELPVEALVAAHREATSGRARNPGAVFMHVLKREARA